MHRHEWTVLFDERGDKLFAFCGYCEKTIACEEIERRLNATEYFLSQWKPDEMDEMDMANLAIVLANRLEWDDDTQA